MFNEFIFLRNSKSLKHINEETATFIVEYSIWCDTIMTFILKMKMM